MIEPCDTCGHEADSHDRRGDTADDPDCDVCRDIDGPCAWRMVAGPTAAQLTDILERLTRVEYTDLAEFLRLRRDAARILPLIRTGGQS